MRGQHRILLEEYIEVDLRLTREEFDAIYEAVRYARHFIPGAAVAQAATLDDVARSLHYIETSLRAHAHDGIAHKEAVAYPGQTFEVRP